MLQCLPLELQDLVASHMDRASLVALGGTSREFSALARRVLRKRYLTGLRERALAAARAMHSDTGRTDMESLRWAYRGKMAMDGGLMRRGFQVQLFDEHRRIVARLYAGRCCVHIAHVHGEDAAAADVVKAALHAAASEAGAPPPLLHVWPRRRDAHLL